MNAVKAGSIGKLVLGYALALAELLYAFAHDALNIVLQSLRLETYPT